MHEGLYIYACHLVTFGLRLQLNGQLYYAA
jgi:hypothetical protein